MELWSDFGTSHNVRCVPQTLQEQIKEKVPFQIQEQEEIQKSQEEEIPFQREEQEVSEHIQKQVLAAGTLSGAGIVPCAATPVPPSPASLSSTADKEMLLESDLNLISLLLKGIKRRKRKKRNVLKLPPKATAQPEDPEAQAGTEMGFSLLSVPRFGYTSVLNILKSCCDGAAALWKVTLPMEGL